MKTRSTIGATIALLLSLVLHFLGLGFVWRVDAPAEPQPSGGETLTQVVAPASTFEDVADPVEEPAEPEPPVEPEVPEPREVPTSDARIASETPQQDATPDTGTEQPVEPQADEPPTPDTGTAPEPTTVTPAEPQQTETTDPNLVPPTGTDTVTDIPDGVPDAPVEATQPPTTAPPPQTPAVTADAPVPSDPVPSEPAPSAAVPTAPVPAAPVTSVAVTPTVPTVSVEPAEVAPEPPVAPVQPETTPAQETQTVEAIEDDSSEQAAALSLRPKLPTKRPAAPVRRGNFGGSSTSTSTTTRRAPSRQIVSPLTSYSRTGVDIFAQQGNGARSGGITRNTGNATTTNYAGRVLAKLNRTAPVAVSGGGWAQVSFVISPNGTLSSVSVLDSSGSSSVNRAARLQVQNAAPFPRPPDGKSKRLSFAYQIQ